MFVGRRRRLRKKERTRTTIPAMLQVKRSESGTGLAGTWLAGVDDNNAGIGSGGRKREERRDFAFERAREITAAGELRCNVGWGEIWESGRRTRTPGGGGREPRRGRGERTDEQASVVLQGIQR